MQTGKYKALGGRYGRRACICRSLSLPLWLCVGLDKPRRPRIAQYVPQGLEAWSSGYAVRDR